MRDIHDSYKRELSNRKRKLDYNEPENIVLKIYMLNALDVWC